MAGSNLRSPLINAHTFHRVQQLATKPWIVLYGKRGSIILDEAVGRRPIDTVLEKQAIGS